MLVTETLLLKSIQNLSINVESYEVLVSQNLAKGLKTIASKLCLREPGSFFVLHGYALTLNFIF